MNIIALNGQEISLGCFVNLHEKTVYTYNGICTKINKYYDAIPYGLLKIMHCNDLHLLCCAKVKDLNTFRVMCIY